MIDRFRKNLNVQTNEDDLKKGKVNRALFSTALPATRKRGGSKE